MRKEEFLNELRSKLAGLPKADIEDHISFYSEAIEDRIDEGKTEEAAVAEIGPVDKIINDIAKETPLVKLVKEKVTPKRSLKGWEIALLILGFPFWFPLVLTALILCLVAYLLIWVFVFVVYAIELALVVSSISGLIIFFASIFTGNANLIALGSFLLAGGGAILLFFGCIGVTKGTYLLSKRIVTSIKSSFIRRGK